MERANNSNYDDDIAEEIITRGEGRCGPTDVRWKDMDDLNVLRPDVVCRVSDHVEETISLIMHIVKGGMAYYPEGDEVTVIKMRLCVLLCACI